MSHHATRNKVRRPERVGVRILRGVLSAVFWIAVWAVVARIVGREVLIPSPYAVAVRFWQLLGEGSFYYAVGRSLLHILVGFLSGIAAALLLGVLCHVSKTAETLFSPLMTVVRATPVASFIILALVVLGKAWVPPLICFLMVLPVVFGTVTTSLEARDKELCEMLTVFRVPAYRRLFYFEIPSLLPGFFGGCRTALGLAWKAGIAAEVLCTPKNTIGSALYDAKIYLETADVFCWTLVVILLSLLFEWGVSKLIRYGSEKQKKEAAEHAGHS